MALSTFSLNHTLSKHDNISQHIVKQEAKKGQQSLNLRDY